MTMSKKKIDLSVLGPIIFLLVIVVGIVVAFAVLKDSGAIVSKPSTENAKKESQKIPEDKTLWKWDETKLGKIRVLDIGRDDCVACVKMHEIMQEMRNEFKDTVSFEIVDLAKYPELEKQFDISSIPTIVVLDGMGRELYRKEGVWYKTEIREFFAKLGLKP